MRLGVSEGWDLPDPPWRRCRRQPQSQKPRGTDHLHCSRGQAVPQAGAVKVLTASQVGPGSSVFVLCCDRSGRAQDLGGHQWDQGERADVGLGPVSWVETQQRWM